MNLKKNLLHDHNSCRQKVMEAAKAYCEQKRLKLTPVREAVLNMLLNEHQALGAYEILEGLRVAGFSAQPPVAYRALNFLRDIGFVHKIEQLNSYIACYHPDMSHSPVFLICQSCNDITEKSIDRHKDEFSIMADETGFQITNLVLEAKGTCQACLANL